MTETHKALLGLETISNNLRMANPKFRAAEDIVRGAVDFCAKIRAELRLRRKALGLDQTQMGERLNLSQSSISKIEKGVGDLGLEMLFQYAQAVGFLPMVTFVPIATDATEGTAGPIKELADLEALELTLSGAEEAIHVARRQLAKQAA